MVLKPLPAELIGLFPTGRAAGRSLSVPLPAGRVLVSSDDGDERPVGWLSDAAAPPGLWARLRGDHDQSGLWPLLLDSVGDEPVPDSPGQALVAAYEAMSSPENHDAAELLAGWWNDHTDIERDDLSPAERLAITAPFGQQWPGLAPQARQQVDADHRADEYSDALVSEFRSMRLGLVVAECGADAVSAFGWGGAANYVEDTAEISTVLRDWERRFGVRVVGAASGALHLSVAAPPINRDDALRVAAEHFAFCPDNVWQGEDPFTLAGYADRLVGANAWTFWWD